MLYKTVLNPNFVVFQLEIQEHYEAGWRLDPNNLPVDTVMYFEAGLIKDEDREAVKAVFKDNPDEIDFNSIPNAPKRGRKPNQ